MAGTQTNAAIDAVNKKTQACEKERVATETSLRRGFEGVSENQKEAYFKAALAKLDLSFEDFGKLAYANNYTAEDKITAPLLNTNARVEKTGKAVADKCMSHLY